MIALLALLIFLKVPWWLYLIWGLNLIAKVLSDKYNFKGKK